MPADPSQVNDVHFFSIRLLQDSGYPYPEFFRQLLFKYLFAKSGHIINLYAEHKVFGKILLVEFLQNEFTAILFKASIVACIPLDGKAKFLEKLFRCFEVITGRNERFDG